MSLLCLTVVLSAVVEHVFAQCATWQSYSGTGCYNNPNLCSTLSDGANVVAPSSYKRSVNSVAQFTCSPGYNGNPFLRCYSSGSWGGSTACYKMGNYCPPGNTANLIIASCVTTIGGTCTVDCEDGFVTTTGNLAVTSRCVGSGPGVGKWDPPWPVCVMRENYCPGLPTPSNAVAARACSTDKAPGRRIYGSCQFECNAGYSPPGIQTAMCQGGAAVGTWTSSPSCYLNLAFCPEISSVSNGYSVGSCLHANVVKIDDICSIRCHPGYANQFGGTVQVLTCEDRGDYYGKWSEALATCTYLENYCASLTAPAHGSMAGNCDVSGSAARRLGGWCEFSCNAGYALQGYARRTCEEGTATGGPWSHSPNSCNLITIFCVPYNLAPFTTIASGCVSRTLGAVCYVTCVPGYQLTGGDGTRTCSSDTSWSGNDPVCTLKPNYCEVRTAPANGVMQGNCHVSGSEERKLGGSCEHSCNMGYEMTGLPEIVCEALDNNGGVWSNPTPACSLLAEFCPPHIAVPFASVVSGCVAGGDLLLGGVCVIECDPGYVLTGGDSTRTCSDVAALFNSAGGGVWSGDDPVCTLKVNYCYTRGAPANGILEGSCDVSGSINRKLGGRCDYFCSMGYSLNGDSSIVCLAQSIGNGQWSAAAPSCTLTPNFCLPHVAVPFASVASGCVAGGDLLLGGVCVIACDPGYALTGGDSTRTCSDVAALFNSAGGGVWSGDDPVCTLKPNYCEVRTAPANGVMQGNCHVSGSEERKLGGSCEHSCNMGYEMTGLPEIVCEALDNNGGVWSNPTPACSLLAEFCPPHIAVPFASVVSGCVAGGDLLLGGVCVIECDPGYTLTGGSGTRTCSDVGALFNSAGGGLWSGGNPVCTLVPNYCSALAAPQNGNTKNDCFTGGAPARMLQGQCSMECDDGYHLSHDDDCECLVHNESHGEWSSESPTCERTPNYCSALVPPPHGSLLDNCTELVESSCGEVQCEDGYYFTGSQRRTCLPDGRFRGEWNGTRWICHDFHQNAYWIGGSPALHELTAGVPATFVLNVTTQYGVPSPAAEVSVGSTVGTTVVGVLALGDGAFEVKVVAKKTPATPMSAVVDGVPVIGSPFELAVVPSFANASTSVLFVTSPQIAGPAVTLTVRPRDSLGNDCLGEVLTYCLGPVGEACDFTMTYAADGFATATAALLVAGNYNISVHVAGELSDTVTLVIVPAATAVFSLEDEFASLVWGSGLAPAGSLATVSSTVHVQARDTYLNHRTTGGDVFFLHYASDGLAEDETVRLHDYHNGRYQATVVFSFSDFYNVRFLLDVADELKPASAMHRVTVSALCLPGWRIPNEGVGECKRCPQDTFSDAPGRATCDGCPLGTSTRALTSDDFATHISNCSCLPGYYHPGALTGLACLKCPRGGTCDGRKKRPYAQPGFTEASSFLFVECATEHACPGGKLSSCGEGYTGFECSSCKAGYYAERGYCYSCSEKKSGIPAMVLPAVLLVLTVLGVVLILNRNRIYALSDRVSGLQMSGIQIGTTFLQLLAVITNLDLNWPAAALELFSIAEITNFSLELFRPECQSSDGEFDIGQKLVVTLVFPVLLVLVILFVGFVLQVARWESWDTVYMMIMSFLGLCYISTSRAVVSFFDCTYREYDGLYHLDANPNYICYSPWWNDYLPFGIAGLVVYVVGVPALFFALLCTNRHHLDDQKVKNRYGSLYANYRENCYWFESAVLIRKLVFVVSQLLVTNDTFTQIIIVELVFFVSVTVFFNWAPYADPRYNALSAFVDMVLMLVLFSGLLFSHPGTTPATRTWLSIIVVVAVPLTLLVIIVVVVRDLSAASMQTHTKDFSELGEGESSSMPSEWELVHNDVFDLALDSQEADYSDDVLYSLAATPMHLPGSPVAYDSTEDRLPSLVARRRASMPSSSWAERGPPRGRRSSWSTLDTSREQLLQHAYDALHTDDAPHPSHTFDAPHVPNALVIADTLFTFDAPRVGGSPTNSTHTMDSSQDDPDAVSHTLYSGLTMDDPRMHTMD